MAGLSTRDMRDYMLSDYQFLQDYQVVQLNACSKGSFVACIKNTDQKVRFIKRKYRQEQLVRFKALHRLYKNGIILADNMFILEECEEPYFYIIEAEIDPNNSRFTTLHRYLYYQDITHQQRKAILAKIKILIDCLHQEGQPFAGLDPRKIILDDQGHLYLAPFDLDFELSMDSYSRAYYSPEVLAGISNNEHGISESIMLKWDIWSFGCICLQLLVFSSPAFLASSLSKQIRLICNLDVLARLCEFQDAVKNIVTNSLRLDIANRTISTSPINCTLLKTEQADIPLREPTLSLTKNLPKAHQQEVYMRQLNIHQASKGDCTLVINFLALSNISFEKELRISIHIDKVFHFYVDFDDKIPKRYRLNKKITLQGSFQQLEQYLSKPVIVELREEEKIAKININLQTIVLSHHGQRIWNSPIVSSYSAGPHTCFPAARMKLSCLLTTKQTFNTKKAPQNIHPANYEIENPSPTLPDQAEPTNLLKEISNNQTELKSEKLNEQYKEDVDNENILREGKQRKRKRQNTHKIPSISEISQRIGAIVEELKRKMAPEGLAGEDEIKKQLSQLLELQ